MKRFLFLSSLAAIVVSLSSCSKNKFYNSLSDIDKPYKHDVYLNPAQSGAIARRITEIFQQRKKYGKNVELMGANVLYPIGISAPNDASFMKGMYGKVIGDTMYSFSLFCASDSSENSDPSIMFTLRPPAYSEKNPVEVVIFTYIKNRNAAYIDDRRWGNNQSFWNHPTKGKGNKDSIVLVSKLQTLIAMADKIAGN